MPPENDDQVAAFWVEVALLRSRWSPSSATTANFVVSHGIVNRAVHAFRDVAAVAACRVAAEDAFHCLTAGTTVGGGVSDQHKLQRSLKNMCKEGAYWGTAAGVYVATESVVEEMRGCTDWKNAVIGGAFAGALMSAAAAAVRNDRRSRGSKVVKDAIAGAAIAAAAEFIGRRSHVRLLAPPSAATVVSSSSSISKGGVAGQTRREREATAADAVDDEDDPWVSGSRGLELPIQFTTSTDDSSD